MSEQVKEKKKRIMVPHLINLHQAYNAINYGRWAYVETIDPPAMWYGYEIHQYQGLLGFECFDEDDDQHCLEFRKKDIGRKFRIWNKMPSEKAREETPWE